MSDNELVEKRIENSYPNQLKAWACFYLRDHYTRELMEKMLADADEFQMKRLAKEYLKELCFWYTTEERANLEKSLMVG